VFRVSPDRFAAFFDTIGLVRVSASSDGNVREYFRNRRLDGDVPRLLSMTSRKIAGLARALSAGSCVYIADEDETDETALRSFLVNLSIRRELSKLALMRKGMNPQGAVPFGRDSSTRLSLRDIRGYDVLMLYRFPLGIDTSGAPTLQFDSRHPRVSGRGLYIPLKPVTETSGTRRLYDGRKKKMYRIFKNDRRIYNIEVLRTITGKLDDV
jgi:hypothetical protein